VTKTANGGRSLALEVSRAQQIRRTFGGQFGERDRVLGVVRVVSHAARHPQIAGARVT